MFPGAIKQGQISMMHRAFDGGWPVLFKPHFQSLVHTLMPLRHVRWELSVSSDRFRLLSLRNYLLLRWHHQFSLKEAGVIHGETVNYIQIIICSADEREGGKPVLDEGNSRPVYLAGAIKALFYEFNIITSLFL